MIKLDTDTEIILHTTDGSPVRCIFGVRPVPNTIFGLAFLYELDDDFHNLFVPVDVMSGDELMPGVHWEELIVKRFIDRVNDNLYRILGNNVPEIEHMADLRRYIKESIAVEDNGLVFK